MSLWYLATAYAKFEGGREAAAPGEDIPYRLVSSNPTHKIVQEVAGEVARASALWAPMNSAHEGYGVLMEEFRELEEHVFMNQNRRDLAAMRKEAVQLAAMAVKFIRDVCDGGRGRV